MLAIMEDGDCRDAIKAKFCAADRPGGVVIKNPELAVPLVTIVNLILTWSKSPQILYCALLRVYDVIEPVPDVIVGVHEVQADEDKTN